MMKARVSDIRSFQKAVWDHYDQHARPLPWRQPGADGSFDPYKILVSEIMLQQTGVNRVIPKYESFIDRFPTMRDLAASSLGNVLVEWSGLGYNRRAKYLHEAAKQLISAPQPWGIETLVACPGIGKNTAAAICVYAYNEPIAFVETNIRTVFIHHFFNGRGVVTDQEIHELVVRTLPAGAQSAREWFWALMDYGTHLKSSVGNAARRSRHYVRQSNFEGSNRQVRGRILRLLAAAPASRGMLRQEIDDPRLDTILSVLRHEGLIVQTARMYHLPR